jgi:hypothetical protein
MSHEEKLLLRNIIMVVLGGAPWQRSASSRQAVH